MFSSAVSLIAMSWLNEKIVINMAVLIVTLINIYIYTFIYISVAISSGVPIHRQTHSDVIVVKISSNHDPIIKQSSKHHQNNTKDKQAKTIDKSHLCYPNTPNLLSLSSSWLIDSSS